MNKIIKEQKNFASIWIQELQTSTAIKRKLEEVKEERKEYLKLINIYNWNKNVISDNLLAFNVFIEELEKAL